jgi:hypothetical protein
MSQTFSTPRTIRHQQLNVSVFADTFYQKLDLRPTYQRDIRWSHKQMNSLVESVMNGDLVPEIILYRQDDADYEYEVIDGQHRSYTLFNFMRGKYVTVKAKKDLIYIPYERDGINIRIFYEETEDTNDYKDKNPSVEVEYLTQANRRRFGNYMLSVQVIESSMEENERQALFLKLQEGIPVRGSDLLKNRMNVPLMRELYELNAEELYKKDLLSFLTVNPSSYWIHWFSRLICMIHDTDYFKYGDSDIKRQIDHNTIPDVLYAVHHEQYTVHSTVNRIFNFMEQFVANYTVVSPCQFYAIADVMKTAPEGWEYTVMESMGEWAKNTDKISMRPRNMDDRMATFHAYKEQLNLLPYAL